MRGAASEAGLATSSGAGLYRRSVKLRPRSPGVGSQGVAPAGDEGAGAAPFGGGVGPVSNEKRPCVSSATLRPLTL